MGTYSIGSQGVGSSTFNELANANTVVLISPTKLVYFENGSKSPAIFVVEK